MRNKPFLMRFKEEIPSVDPALVNVDFEYDQNQQANVTSDGELLWRASKPYTNCWTPPRTIPGHYTPKNKWVPTHGVPGKTDRRSGK